jgi:hypothetical protein
LPSFYGAIVKSSYLDWLSEYDTYGKTPGSSQFIGRGTYKGAYTIAPAATGTTVTSPQIAAELVSQIAAGHLPAPSFDGGGNVNTFYAVDFPLGYTIEVQFGGGSTTSCVEFCTSLLTMTVDGKRVPYGVFPDIGPGSPCSGGCGTAANYLDNVGSVHSEQLLNAITAPRLGDISAALEAPLAWYADGKCGTIGYACNAQSQVVAAYTVQRGWSNKQAACVVTGPDTPICSGPIDSGCRGCTVSDDGTGCSGASPRCDTSPNSPTYGTCIAAPAPDAGTSPDASSISDAGPTSDVGPPEAMAANASDATAGTSCVPGQQIACACVGGGVGAQSCLVNGTGYALCQCPDASAADATAATSSSGCGCSFERRGAGLPQFAALAALLAAVLARPGRRRLKGTLRRTFADP